MHTPRRSALAALACACVLLAAGCGSSTTPAGDVLGGIKVEGSDPATAPTVTIAKMPLKATSTVSKVITEGDGAAVTKDDIATINAVIVNGTDGKVVDSTWAAGSTAGVDLASDQLFAAIKTSLPDKKVGSRVLVAAPQKDVFGAEGNASAGLKATDSVVFVIDILGATQPLAEAKGAAVEPKPELPSVEFKGTDTPAVITIPAGAQPPAELVVQPLITGEGAEVADGQTVRVSYTGALWKDGSVFDSSASHDPKYFQFPVGQGKVISGWDKAVKGQKVGSRLLLVVPPAEGYGANGNPPTISGTDTLVFVVDILAAY
ncbi:MAG: FKBP-type peptidyl-prolyl cis-trans isomerase [Dermatophilaceae bacterium]